MTARRHRGATGREGGQATVEVALALPVVTLALLLVVQVALVARGQLQVAAAAREGARAAAIDAAPGAAERAALAASGLRPERAVVASEPRGPVGTMVRVTVTYRVPTDVPLVGRLVGEPTLTSSVAMRVEGDPAPP